MDKSLVTFALLMFIFGSAKCGYGDPSASGYAAGPPPSNGGPQYVNPTGGPNYGAPGPMQGAQPVKPGYMGQTQEWIQHHRDQQEYDRISYVYWTIPNEPYDPKQPQAKITMTPTIKPLPTNPGLPNEVFDARSQAARIWSILNRVTQGSREFDEDRTNATRIITAISTDQRKEIAVVFEDIPAQKRKSEKERLTLDRFFERKYMLNSEKFMRRIAKDPAKLDAYYLHEALTGKKDWKDVNEFATTRSNKQYEKLHQVYQDDYDKELREVIISATGGAAKAAGKMFGKLTRKTKNSNPYQDLLLRIFDGERDEYNLYNYKVAFSKYFGYTQYNLPNMVAVATDVRRLAESADSDVYSEILGERSLGHIRAIMSELKVSKSMSLEGLIKKNFNKEENYKNLLLTICKVATNMPAFFAERFKKAMDQGENGLISGALNRVKNGSLNDDDFQRYIASRSPVDLGVIQEEFLNMYEVSLLEKACQEDEIYTRPEYLMGVIAMLIGNDPVTGYTENYDRNKLPASCKMRL